MRRQVLALVAVALGLSPVCASAQQTPVTLKYADSLPVEHFAIRLLVKPFMDEVTRRTNGAVKFERFPSQQLGKAADMLSLTQSGVVDIGYFVPTFVQ